MIGDVNESSNSTPLDNESPRLYDKQHTSSLSTFAKRVRCSPDSFKIGQAVWLHRPTNTDGSSGKLSRKWHGPYRITRVMVDNNTVRIKDAITGVDEPMEVNMDRIRPYVDVDGKDDESSDLPTYQPNESSTSTQNETTSSTSTLRTTRRPTIRSQQLEPDDKVDEVRSVIDERVREDGTPEYLVRWLNFPKNATSWVSQENFHAFERLQEFSDQQANRRASQRLALWPRDRHQRQQKRPSSHNRPTNPRRHHDAPGSNNHCLLNLQDDHGTSL